MHLVLSGEGKTDLGLFIESDSEFIAGSMYYIVDKIIEKEYDYSFYENKDECITFIPKVELKKLTNKFPPFTGKKGKKGTGYFINNAIALAKKAKEISEEKRDEVIAILFRDSDGTNSSPNALWEDKVQSIENGFMIEKFETGIAMVPKPKSEGWLICALKENPYQSCDNLEDRSGNDSSPNSLKKELESFEIENDRINDMIKTGNIDLDKIKLPSFLYFYDRLKNLL